MAEYFKDILNFESREEEFLAKKELKLRAMRNFYLQEPNVLVPHFFMLC